MNVKELRPVEALYLLYQNDKEEFDDENALAAALVYLSMEGHIKPKKKGEGFVVTDKPTANLRPYEKDLLKAIRSSDDEDILSAVDDFNFKKFMTENGFYEIRPEKKKFLFFKWTANVRHRTTKFSEAQKHLIEVKKQIKILKDKKKFDNKMFAMTYAFPSAGLTNGFLKYAKDVVGEVESIQASHVAVVAAAVAASAAASSAAAISAACAGGACGG